MLSDTSTITLVTASATPAARKEHLPNITARIETVNATSAGESFELSGGAIAGIVIGSVAALGGGGFSLFWFVIKKKKWSDLIGIFKK